MIREKNALNTMDFARGIRDSLNAHGFDYSLLLPSGIQHEPYAFFENGRYTPVDPESPPDNRSTVLRKNGRYEITDNGTCEIVEAGEIPARCDVNYDSSQVGRILTAKAAQFIDDHLALNEREGRERPFLLYFASQAIHVPHTPPIDFEGDPEVLDRPVQGITGGRTSDVLYELDLQLGAHDWVATMYELTGQAMSENQAMDSASLLPILTGTQKGPLHEFVIYQAGFAYEGAIRNGSMVLLIDRKNEATELYDLATDIGQERNLIADPRYTDEVARLRAKFLRYNDHDDETFDEPRTTPAFGVAQ